MRDLFKLCKNWLELIIGYQYECIIIVFLNFHASINNEPIKETQTATCVLFFYQLKC